MMIRSRKFILLFLILTGVTPFTFSDTFDFRGTVVDEEGKPVADAQVDVWTAGPLEGVGSVCPYCYLDCGKSAISGRDGAFVLPSLQDDLKFRVLIIAKGYEPTFAADLSKNSTETSFTLKPLDENRIPPEKRIRIKVSDVDGKPLKGCLVTFGSDMKTARVTGEDGMTTLEATHPDADYEILAQRMDHAPKALFVTKAAGPLHTITLKKGATVSGTVYFKTPGGVSMPVANAVVRVHGIGFRRANANSDIFYNIATDEDGDFTVYHLGTDWEYDFNAWVIEENTVTQSAPFQRIVYLKEGEERKDVDLVLEEVKSGNP